MRFTSIPNIAIYRGAAIVLFLVAGAGWIIASPQPIPQSDTLLLTPLNQSRSSKMSIPPAVPMRHELGTVTISPPSIAFGSSQPVIITITITDPNIIKSSVDLLQVQSSGQSSIIGQLNDNGQNGDLVASDGVYSISRAFNSFPMGTFSFRISAAFVGSLRRVESPAFSLLVTQQQSTTSWATFTDSQSLFSIKVPAAWGLTSSEVFHPDPDTIKAAVFAFPSGATAFIITVHTLAGWTELQNSGFTSPEEVGVNNTYVFGWSEPQDQIITPGITDAAIRSDFDAIKSSFHMSSP